MEVRERQEHNLSDVDVDVPLGLLSVTGAAGSGKSGLVHSSMAGREGVVVIDQGAIRGSRRGDQKCTGLLEPIREAFAKADGVKPSLFSLNSEGGYEACIGAGVIFTELGMMATVEVTLRGVRGAALPGVQPWIRPSGSHNIAEPLAIPIV